MLNESKTHPSAAPAHAAAAGPDAFLAFCDAVRRICGIDLAQYKRGQMERRVLTFVERRGSTDLVAYAAQLRTDKAELDAFLDRVTINVSQLYRNPDLWSRLEQVVLPELMAAGRLRAWSAGCSYGAEAFTLAALARGVAPSAAIRITGTDIDPRIVARAQAGAFTEADARDAPAVLLRRFFTPTEDGGWQATPELMRSTTFEVGDLLRHPVRPAAHDLVLCRNTVIYFTDEVRDALHARLAASLRPGGYLVIGATERVTDPGALGLDPTMPFIYRKAD